METNSNLEPGAINCPKPMTQVIKVDPSFINAADFNSAQIASSQQNTNYQQHNKGYVHTFEWKPEKQCCQVMKAVLTLVVKPLQKASNQTTPDAGNDNVNVVGNGGIVFSGHSFLLYPPNTKAGTEVTKTINITGLALAYLNANKRISIYIQDDTTVLSTTSLKLDVCCLG